MVVFSKQLLATSVVRFLVEDSEIICGLHPVKNSDIETQLGGRIYASSFLRKDFGLSKSYYQALLFITQGPSFVLYPSAVDRHLLNKVTAKWRKSLQSPPGQPGKWEEQFTLAYASIGVSQKQIVLVTVPCEAGGDQEPFSSLILGFEIPYGSLEYIMNQLSQNRIPVILDLDDTLLLAYSLGDLKLRIDKARKRRLSGENVEKELQRLKQDLTWLTQFYNTDSVEIGSTKIAASMESDGNGLNRPVVRMESQSVILTRINPKDRNTSMLIRLRPGWVDLKEELMKKQQFGNGAKVDVFISTTADRDYALEAWRLLDPDQELIAKADLATRLCSVKNGLKTMKSVFKDQIHDYNIQDVPGPWDMPLAIIADDRRDIWEAGAQGQIIKVEPFAPHSRIAEMEEAFRRDGHLHNIPWLSLKQLTNEISNACTRFWYLYNFGYEAGQGLDNNPYSRLLALTRMKPVSAVLRDEGKDKVWEWEIPTEDQIPLFTGMSNCEIIIPHPAVVKAEWYVSNPVTTLKKNAAGDQVTTRKRSSFDLAPKLHKKQEQGKMPLAIEGRAAQHKVARTKLEDRIAQNTVRTLRAGSNTERGFGQNDRQKDAQSSAAIQRFGKRPKVCQDVWKILTVPEKRAYYKTGSLPVRAQICNRVNKTKEEVVPKVEPQHAKHDTAPVKSAVETSDSFKTRVRAPWVYKKQMLAKQSRSAVKKAVKEENDLKLHTMKLKKSARPETKRAKGRQNGFKRSASSSTISTLATIGSAIGDADQPEFSFAKGNVQIDAANTCFTPTF